MPLYEYECSACGQRFEAIQKFSDAPITACKACGKGPVEKLLSSPAIQFKGEGWYITDYARKDAKDGAKKEGGSTESGAPPKGTASKDGDSTSSPGRTPPGPKQADSGSATATAKKD